tara:strand:- start:6892 stop:7113 length:222 start_codon:yes stop_codon:yes gene_type:complete
MKNQIDIQTHAYISILTETKEATLEELNDFLDKLGADEIDPNFSQDEIRIYFDNETRSRMDNAMKLIEHRLKN